MKVTELDRQRQNQRGIALLDALLAVFVFAMAVTSLANWLAQIGNNSNMLAREKLIQHGLAGVMAEARERSLSDMSFEYYDEELDVRYRTVVEPLDLTTSEGDSLDDMHLLQVIAEYSEGAEVVTTSAEIYVYKPEDDR